MSKVHFVRCSRVLTFVFALAAGVTVLSACGGGQMLSAASLPEEATGSPTGAYRIGPGDRLEIFVWRQPELSVTVPVRPDGRISTPLVEDLEAVGKTPTQLAGEIENVLSEFIRAPEVNVIVENFEGVAGEQIRVVGQAAEPRSLGYRQGMTLLDVMIEVGGLNEFAAGNRARVVRTQDGQSRQIRVRLDDLINEGEIEQNMAMRPGDIVIIPEAIF